MVGGAGSIHDRSMDYLPRPTRPRLGVRARRPFAHSIAEPVGSIEERMPRWIIAGLLMLVCVQLAIAL